MYFSQHYQSLKRLLIGLFLHGFNQMLSYGLSAALSKVIFVVYYNYIISPKRLIGIIH